MPLTNFKSPIKEHHVATQQQPMSHSNLYFGKHLPSTSDATSPIRIHPTYRHVLCSTNLVFAYHIIDLHPFSPITCRTLICSTFLCAMWHAYSVIACLLSLFSSQPLLLDDLMTRN